MVADACLADCAAVELRNEPTTSPTTFGTKPTTLVATSPLRRHQGRREPQQPGAEPTIGAAIDPNVGAGEVFQQQCQELGVPNPALCHIGLLLQTTAAAVPILLFANRFGIDTEARQLRPLAQAALHLGEAGEARQRDDVVPQFTGVVGRR